ncbi:MAG: helix-turn-helix domain-containing protein, partial [Aurantibacter sp.]
IFAYLLIDAIELNALKYILIAGPFLLPFSFWQFSKSLFSDQDVSAQRTTLFLLLTLFAYYGLYILDGMGFSKVTDLLSRILSIFFVIMALIESQAGKSVDLDNDRLRLRKYFIYFIGALVLATLIVEIGVSKKDQEYPRIAQRASILLINSLFIIFNFSIKSRLLSKRKKKTEIRNPKLVERIQAVMLDQQLYRQEKLTIGQLAETIHEQEYKCRKAINQDLGYRNFLDFTNSFRIKEATSILKDDTKSDLTVLEIAYKTGFNSIGPFNRAFKATTGMTPTAFRKKHLS